MLKKTPDISSEKKLAKMLLTIKNFIFWMCLLPIFIYAGIEDKEIKSSLKEWFGCWKNR